MHTVVSHSNATRGKAAFLALEANGAQLECAVLVNSFSRYFGPQTRLRSYESNPRTKNQGSS